MKIERISGPFKFKGIMRRCSISPCTTLQTVSKICATFSLVRSIDVKIPKTFHEASKLPSHNCIANLIEILMHMAPALLLCFDAAELDRKSQTC